MTHQLLILANRYSHPKQRLSWEVPEGPAQVMQDCIQGKRPWPLFLTGVPGSGKTCAALVAVDHYEVGRHYFTEDDLCRKANKAACGELVDGDGYKKTDDAFFRELKDARLVVIDELGMRREYSDARYATVKEVIDSREGKPLILISNKSIAEIARLYDDRIASRIVQGTQLKFPDVDRRMRKGGAA